MIENIGSFVERRFYEPPYCFISNLLNLLHIFVPRFWIQRNLKTGSGTKISHHSSHRRAIFSVFNWVEYYFYYFKLKVLTLKCILFCNCSFEVLILRNNINQLTNFGKKDWWTNPKLYNIGLKVFNKHCLYYITIPTYKLCHNVIAILKF